jgi:hypothetical protein
MDNFLAQILEMPPPLTQTGVADYFSTISIPTTTSSLPCSTTSSNGPLEASENVITLVDSSGREFHTNLHASDMCYLVKYSILSGLRADMKNQHRRQVTCAT